MNELALFAGAGGGILGGHLLGWRTVCAVEWEPYAACVLAARQNDGILPAFPIWDDVQTFDGKPWAGRVDVISGGFPCQDISAAGRGAGIKGTRSGMWFHMARIIGEVRPHYVYVENSPMLTSRGLHRVLGDLAEMGFDARWGVVSAADVGAPHKRDRIWIIAHSTSVSRDEWRAEPEGQQREAGTSDGGDDLADANGLRQLQQERIEQNQRGWFGDRGGEMANSSSLGLSGQRQYEQSVNSAQSRKRQAIELVYGRSPDFWAVEPDVGRVADGVAARVDRLKAIGNGQVPAVAATAWRLLK